MHLLHIISQECRTGETHSPLFEPLGLKAETINRLLKKQSRPRNKRTMAQRHDRDKDDVPPGSINATRSNSVSAPKRRMGEEQDEAGDEEEQKDEKDDRSGREVHVSTMYRWISTSRISVPPAVDADGDTTVDAPPTMRISFSDPVSVLPTPRESQTESAPRPLQSRHNEKGDGRRSDTHVQRLGVENQCGTDL
ncbi:hypothetical protein Hypma_012545 [Hypsizygus marmoreus]|uniref:INO80 complex subunit B-like conserved region domain-containing protein n=1 Tax=Hypsizygus marmoreus TaxID=39966 RepID=A0A369JL05_HYPMA|nr:hypothetical protein Hypma_012545 [Hypsizygus marmoreus]